jgi:hypothetical protein
MVAYEIKNIAEITKVSQLPSFPSAALLHCLFEQKGNVLYITLGVYICGLWFVLLAR